MFDPDSRLTAATAADPANVAASAHTIWLTGLSGSGKSTLACGLAARLTARGRPCYVLDGDQLRRGLSRDLGFGDLERRENVRRAAEVARLFNEAGFVVLAALVSPRRADRALAAKIVGPSRFVEIHLATPLDVCERRDVKGLYRQARRGVLPDFTGVSAPYEAPVAPDLVLDTSRIDLGPCIDIVLNRIDQRGSLRYAARAA